MRNKKLYYSLTLLLAFCLSSSAFAANFYQAKKLRISSEVLSESLSTSNLVIIDARTPLQYQRGHLPGAVNFPASWSYQSEQSGRLVQPSKMQSIMQNLGINTLDKVVIYDDGQLNSATRIFWALEVYGVHHVQVLVEGFKEWKLKRHPVNQIIPKIDPSEYTPCSNPKVIANKFNTFTAIYNPFQTIIDTRTVNTHKNNISKNHIQTAINIPISSHFEQYSLQRKLHSVKNLTKLYESVPKTAKTILYGSKKQGASIHYFALRELNFNVAIYDGGWQEWSHDPNMTVINPVEGEDQQ